MTARDRGVPPGRGERRRGPAASGPGHALLAARAIADGIRSPGFRGCAFLNAVAEYPDPDHPVHRTVLAHRQWFLETVTGLLGRAGLEPADAAGRHFVMLRDGAMAAGCLFDPELVCETFLSGVESLLTTGAPVPRG
ncbi:hypothetical protein GA0115245_10674 [Streptomyces sp. di188]|nr:hypothetical protein GA0115245_10674 [Streptomyces sp. di188]SCD89095.1 hypothetical protein GA0115238_13133 [Streptomyces sp. di50b]